MLSDIMLNVIMLSVVARLELIRVEHLTGLHSNGRHLALPENVRLGSGKHSSLLRYGNNYGREKVYSKNL